MNDKVVRTLSETPICGVYQITNKINGKFYIGQSIDIERRWNQHKYGKGSLILKNAIKKHGLENFEFKLLETINYTNKSEVIKQLMRLEEKWLKTKKPFSYKNGYNINETAKPNLTPNKNNDFGKKVSKIKIENNHCGKPIHQFDLDGNFIKKWESAAQIERTLGYKSENISACCLKKQNSSHNFIWRFKKNEINQIDIDNANKSLKMSEVRQYNLKGELINKYENIKVASIKTGFNESTIRDVCGGNKKTGCGYIWKYKNEPLILKNHINVNNYPINQYNLKGELIKKWENVKEIINTLNLNRHSTKCIYKCCNNIKNHYLNYKWGWG